MLFSHHLPLAFSLFVCYNQIDSSIRCGLPQILKGEISEKISNEFMKKNIFLKLFAVVIVLAVTVSAFAGCQPQNAGGTATGTVTSDPTGNTPTGGDPTSPATSDDTKDMTPAELLAYVEGKSFGSIAGVLGDAIDALAKADIGANVSPNGSANIELKLTTSELLRSELADLVADSAGQKFDLDFLKEINASLKVNMADPMTQIGATVGLSGKDIISADVIANLAAGNIWLTVPDYAEGYLGVKLPDTSVDVDSAENEIMEEYLKTIKSLPEKEVLVKLLNKYFSLITENVSEVEKSSVSVSVNGVSQELTALTTKIYVTDAARIVKAVLTEAKADSELKAVLDELYLFEVSSDFEYDEATGEYSYVTTVTEIDAYAAFIEAADEILDSIEAEDEFDSESFFHWTTYIDGANTVVGRKVEMVDGEEAYVIGGFYHIAVENNGSTAMAIVSGENYESANQPTTSIPAFDSETKISGSGTVADGIANGKYTVSVQGIELFEITLKNVDTKAVENGNFKGTVGFKFINPLMPEYPEYPDYSGDVDSAGSAVSGISTLITKLMVELDIDTTGEADKVTLSVYYEDALLANLEMAISAGESTAVTAPDSYYDANDQEQMMTWLSSLDLGKLIAALTEAGVDQNLLNGILGGMGGGEY